MEQTDRQETLKASFIIFIRIIQGLAHIAATACNITSSGFRNTAAASWSVR
jgi:hypothetical protein